ncbi:MAG: hypothetical protein FJ083_13890 [Cyanobacteria bacterium K_Offshore_surface_m2_239]|nr:hypothetical protein [Cyanobacteria bacterium K_Offshore_surface_m2_239]
MGADGRFANYDRILKEVDIADAADYARLTEALGITLERIAPEDFQFITTQYGREKLAAIMSSYFRQEELGIADAELLAQATVRSMPALNAVENKVWLRFFADRAKRNFIDDMGEIVNYMNALPGAEVPRELLDEGFRSYRLALALERHNNLVTRRHAQALRSQQEDLLSLRQFALDQGDEGESEVFEALSMTGSNIPADHSFSRIIEAAADNRPQEIQRVLDGIEVNGLDPKTRLDKDWLNTTMRVANGYIKDSQLLNMNSNRLNLFGGGAMMLYAPVQETLYNGFRMVKMGDALGRAPILEAMRITAEASQYALSVMKTTWKSDMARVFHEGISHYSGNLDTYGKALLTNRQEIEDLQRVLDMRYKEGIHWTASWANPLNVAIFGNKLQASARILVLTKPGGMVGSNAGMNRWEAAYWALGFGDSFGNTRRPVRARDIEAYLPWKTALRAMAAVDEVYGHTHFLAKLRSNLEVKARMEGAQLGLLDDQDRAAWVQRQLDEAVFSATPTEADIINFRQMNGIKGSDMSNEEVGAEIARQRLAGAPTLSTAESVDAMDWSARMRFQAKPEGDSNELAPFIDASVMNARQAWWMDRYALPYWRSVFGGMLLDWRLGQAGVADLVRSAVRGREATAEDWARGGASLTIAGMLMMVFTALDTQGQIGGSQDPHQARRNTVFGIPVAGIPLLNTLLLWKDIKDAKTEAGVNDYDGQEVAGSVTKVLAGWIMRQAGIAQFQMVTQALMDNTGSSMEKLQRFVGFMGSSQIPFIGPIRQAGNVVGARPTAFFRDAPDTAEQSYLLDKDDPFAQTEQGLRNLLADTLPLAALAAGAKLKRKDALGSPIRGDSGIDWTRINPFAPAEWPRGEINDVVYGELATQDISVLPVPLQQRKLEGIAMSDKLQEEYNDIIGSIKADATAPPSALLPLRGRSMAVKFSLPTNATTYAGVRIRQNDTASLPLAKVVDRVVRGRTRKEALYQLFKSKLYQAMEDDPSLSANPPGGLPRAMRRQRTSQRLVAAITDYYDLLTQRELERRAMTGESPAAADWAQKRSELTRRTFQEGLRGAEALGGFLEDPAE